MVFFEHKLNSYLLEFFADKPVSRPANKTTIALTEIQTVIILVI